MPEPIPQPEDTVTPQTTIWHILVCPACKRKLRQAATGAACPDCGRTFPRSARGQLDLRLTGKDKIALELWLDHDDPGDVNDPGYLTPFPANPAPEVDFRGLPIPVRLDARLLSYFPQAKEPGALMLDLGCGACLHRPVRLTSTAGSFSFVVEKPR